MLPILLTFWPFMEKVFKNNKKCLGNCSKENEEKIQRNALSSLNAIGTIVLGLLYLKTKSSFFFMAAILYPIVFYVYDTYYIWFNKKDEGFTYIIHHLAAIYYIQCIYLYDTKMRNVMLFGLICIELSNLPLYFVYDFLKKNNEKNIEYYKKLLGYKKIQLLIYGFFRIVIYGYIIYNYSIMAYHQPILVSSIYLIFFMGAYWLQHQIKGYFKTKNEYKELLKNENNE